MRTASALWRWADDPADAELAAFLDEFAAAADPAAVRARQTEGSCYTLITYSRRSVLRALRTEDPAAALSAFAALSVVEMSRVDPRDMAVAAALASHGARRVGLDPALVLDGPVTRAEPAVASLLAGAARGDAGTGGYHELRTKTGPVLIDARGPVAGAVALVKAGLAVAAVVEDDGRYAVRGVATELNMPAVWITETPAYRKVKRVVSVTAEPPDTSAHFLLTFLLETDSPETAATLAAATRDDMPGAVILGVAAGKRCAVVIARSVVLGVPTVEDDRSLSRLAEPVRAVLA